MTFFTYYLLIGLMFFGSLGVKRLKELLDVVIFYDEKPDATEDQSRLRNHLCNLYGNYITEDVLTLVSIIIVFVVTFVYIILWPKIVCDMIIYLGKKML